MKLFSYPTEAHRRLSPSAAHFLDHVERRPELLRRHHFKSLLDPDFQFKGLQPWPTFLSQATVGEISQFVGTMDRLIKSIPSRVFHDEPARISAFFGLNEADVHFILHRPSNITSAISRPDFILTAEGFKCMEVNVGSHLEGWHLSAICENYLKDEAIQAFVRDQGIEVGYTNTTRRVLAHFIREVVSQPYFAGEEINVGIVIPPAGHGYEGYFSQRFLSEQFAAAINGTRPGLRGQCVLCTAGDLEPVGSAIHAKGMRMHAVYDQTPLPAGVFKSVFRASMAKALEFQSSLCTSLLSDKRLLAILSDPDWADCFTQEERQFIERYVPWTRLLKEASTSHRGRDVRLPGFVLAGRDFLVLKRGQSTKQNDIFIGPTTSVHGWEAAVRHALEEGCWVVQEFLDSQQFYYQYGLDGYTLQDVVFATFAVGGEYAGSWLRMRPTEIKGAINRSYGADIGLTLEVND